MVISLAAARINAGLSQQKVAELLNKTRHTIWNWENGKTKPDINCAKALCDLYGVSMDSIKEFA